MDGGRWGALTILYIKAWTPSTNHYVLIFKHWPFHVHFPQSTLEQLDLEQFSSQVIKYGKYVNQLEKGLPKNNVVPTLKEKVEVMKQRVGRKMCCVVPDTNVCRAYWLTELWFKYGLEATDLLDSWLNYVTLSKFSCLWSLISVTHVWNQSTGKVWNLLLGRHWMWKSLL